MTRRVPISFDRLMTVLGSVLFMGPNRSWIDIDDDTVTVRMSWAFQATFPRAAIIDARHDTSRVWGWGVHGWRGRWLVNGSSREIVVLDLSPTQRARVLGIPVRLRQLAVSVADADELIALLDASRSV